MNPADVARCLLLGAVDELARALRSVRPMRNSEINDSDQSALQRDPDEWKTGDEPMTDAQRSYLETLCRETGEDFEDSFRKRRPRSGLTSSARASPRLAQDEKTR